MMKRKIRLSTLALALSVIAAFSSGVSSCLLTVSPASVDLLVGQTITFTASSFPAQTVAWSSSDPAVATVDAQGLVTAVAPGIATITATGNSDGTQDSASVRVEAAAADGGDGTVPALAPGLTVEVVSVTIPADGRPEVVFKAKDNNGNLLSKQELTDARFILDYLDPTPPAGTPARFISYTTRISDGATQAYFDTARLNGVTENSDGTMTYKFAQNILTKAVINSATHQLGGQFRRLYAVDGKAYVYNLIHRFRPDGQAVTQTREIVNIDTCNNCHTRLAMHGNIRRQVQLCILCHNAQTTDGVTGNSVNFPTMVHKIHMGANLPSVLAGVPYQIEDEDFSEIEFPQPVQRCVVCHTNAPQADVYKTNPTLEGCAACHDRTWYGNPDDVPEGYEPHLGGQQVDNSLCALCHVANAPGVAPIVDAHVVPTESAAAPGLALDITDVSIVEVAEASKLQIILTAVDKNGAPYTDITAVDYVAANYGWPASDYQANVREIVNRNPSTGPQGTLVNNGDGSYVYTFAANLPQDSTDTFAVGLEGYKSFTFRGETIRQGTATNGLMYFTLDGSEPQPRRTIVDYAKCNKCHGDLRMHGGSRVGVEYCVICHRPNNTDIAQRPADQLPPESIHYKRLIHKIHTGHELENPFTVYGFGGSAHDFTEIHFPGDRRKCEICHVPGSYGVPLPDEALPTVITQDDGATLVAEILPTRAACITCHDGTLPDVHAVVMSDTENDLESCAVCHGSSAEFSVANAHQIEP
ncbi:MAG: OmcA/MtrC family decaheme c-type cytochrome [Candidatus Hydrogenedentes bacterium]|nr:OmcA/MtrC family decaheme c-type cytochrome [Candidatus Hydrogenedentota bacterium]